MKKRIQKLNEKGELVGGLECMHVYLAPALKTTIEQLAKQESVSMSTLIRQAVVRQYRQEIRELSKLEAKDGQAASA